MPRRRIGPAPKSGSARERLYPSQQRLPGDRQQPGQQTLRREAVIFIGGDVRGKGEVVAIYVLEWPDKDSAQNQTSSAQFAFESIHLFSLPLLN